MRLSDNTIELTNKQKRKLISHYFSRKFPLWALFLFIIGILFLYIKNLTFIGFYLIIFSSILFHFLYFNKLPDDKQIDQWLEEDFQRIYKESLLSFTFEEKDLIRKSIKIKGPIWWEIEKKAFSFLKNGFYCKEGKKEPYKDGNKKKYYRFLRFSHYNIYFFHFTENYLLCYGCILNFITGDIYNVNTDEYFYKDIVSASKVTKSEQYPDLYKPFETRIFNKVEEFIITTTGGTKVKVFLKAKDLEESYNGRIKLDNIDNEIKKIRHILHTKKT